MKKLTSAAFTALCLLVISCSNQDTKTTTPSVKTAEPEKKTEISVGADGTQVKTKSGTEVKISNEAVHTTDKKTDIKIKKP